MIRTFARRAAVAAVPLITLPVIMLAAAPGTAFASAPAATIHFKDQAQLLPDGSALVTVDYSCFPTNGLISVSMTQQTGAFGSDDGAAVCDGKKHSVSLDVTPGPFSRGSATATARLFSLTSNATTQAKLKVR